jgi:hypothetical protein
MLDVSSTAQTLGSVASLSPQALLTLLVSVVLAIVSAPAVQAVIEGAIASFLPSWAFFAKPFIPSAVAGLVGKLATINGLPGIDAVAGGLALASALHWVNEQPWAASLEGKFPKVWAILQGVSPKVGAFLLVAFLGLGAGLHADGTEMIATINPSASGTMFLVDHQGNLVKNNASLYGADIVVGLVSVSGNVASPTLFGGLGAGMVQDAEMGSNRLYGKVMVGYWLFNAFCAYDGLNTRIGAGVTAPLTLLTGTYKVLKTNF